MSKKNKSNFQKKKSGFFKFLESVVRTCYGKKELVGLENIPDEPCVIIGNHAQIHGPFTAELLFPYKKYVWLIGQMMNVKEIPTYAIQDFWPYKPKSTRWFYKILSYVIAPICAYVHKNADGIGVYKDMRALNTFKQSVTGLKEGAHIIIFPECHTPFNNIVNDFQDNFVDVAKLYYKSTGKELLFVPMYIAPKLKKVVFGKPIKYDATAPSDEHKKYIRDSLKMAITDLAVDLPVHTVVPYANIKKKDYPKSK